MLGAGESPSVQMLAVASTRLSIDDAAVVMVCRSLMCSCTLRLLVLDGWSFRMNVSAILLPVTVCCDD